MQIRREDKEFINYIGLLGAGIGAILAVLAVFHFRDNAKNQLSQQKHYVQQNSLFLALANPQPIEDSGEANNIAGGFLDNVKQDNAKLGRLENGFWATLPLAGLMVLCATACVGGFIGGGCSVWLISAIGTIGTIKIIRLTYKIIWRIRPEFDGGKQQIQNYNNVLIKRDKHRVLPGVLIISVMGLIGMIILWVVVYYCAG